MTPFACTFETAERTPFQHFNLLNNRFAKCLTLLQFKLLARNSFLLDAALATVEP